MSLTVLIAPSGFKIAATQGVMIPARVTGPVGQPVASFWRLMGGEEAIGKGAKLLRRAAENAMRMMRGGRQLAERGAAP